MEAAIAALNTWGPLGLLIIVGFVWIWRVEQALERHEDQCRERYGLIFSGLAKLREDVSTLLERTKQ